MRVCLQRERDVGVCVCARVRGKEAGEGVRSLRSCAKQYSRARVRATDPATNRQKTAVECDRYLLHIFYQGRVHREHNYARE